MRPRCSGCSCHELLIALATERLERSGAYERPADFQAADIVMVGCGLTGWWVGMRVADGVGGVESKVADAARICSSPARDCGCIAEQHGLTVQNVQASTIPS